MKLKEFIPSLTHTIQLVSKSAKQLRQPKNVVPVIVSLTTIPYRLNKVHITIRSILNQSTAPEKIILWLHEDLKNAIPKSLKKLEGSCFSIQFSSISCPHLKLVETLAKHSDCIIVTCDDDMIYPNNWLETIYNTHKANPKKVITNFSREISYKQDGSIKPYKNWPYNKGDESDKLLPLGVGGVLYPPHALHKDATNTKLFLTLCPKADDLWFKAMALINNTETYRLQTSIPLIPVMFTQKVSLKKQNIGKDFNVEQWKNLSQHFNL
ncbi:hypothetical protein [Neptunitalea lumnitzerae]|uniref:Glycosyltransferase n=1 Tax=Neptunitalea lumnitzerae TaxID=2965509 RepID=A0ABQ5MKM8_9FLAO|nr:hypothetical protein [Neptunitalea sp. Y10]GLB49960.1 hypothetical protein Y10_23280 [Neptunitalea sp. Y10]